MNMIKKQRILNAAMSVAIDKGYRNVTRDDVALAAKVSAGSVSGYFTDMQGLRDAMMQESIRLEILPIIRQGLAFCDPLANNAPGELRIKALSYNAGV